MVEHLSYVEINNKPFEEFKSFIDSLDEEKKSWSLDTQTFKDEKNWYDFHASGAPAYFLLHKNKIIGLINGYQDPVNLEQFEVSFVVKSKYQGNGLGTQLLLIIERELESIAPSSVLDDKKYVIKRLVAKHYKDNIASHKAFLKAGWSEAKILEDDGTTQKSKGDMVFKIKLINQNIDKEGKVNG